MADTSQRRLWYLRRDGEVTGPFPSGQISREILLGRIRDSDEISQDRETWKPLHELPGLLPDVLRDADAPDAHERLTLARLREDERAHDRRSTHESPVESDRRSGDRRNVESFAALAFRARRAERVTADAAERNLLLPAAVLLTIAFSLAMYFLWYRPAVPPPDRNCDAPAAPGVNWSGCSRADAHLAGVDLREANLVNAVLSGDDLRNANLLRADLSYANLENIGLTDAVLREARLKGAVLRGANLARSDLRDADLSYAILEAANFDGAMLSGARLDRAVWRDGRVCAVESIGECR